MPKSYKRKEKIPKKKRKPTTVLRTSIRATVVKFASEFLESKTFHHAGTKGRLRELPIIDFFKNHLPGTYNAVSGEVVDTSNNHSPQLDVMIYDEQRNFAFSGKKGILILPAEALLASIEVKSSLTKQGLKKSFRAAKKLKSLKPFGILISPYRKRGKVSDAPRYFHCIFAYNSNLKADKGDWIDREYKRISDTSDELDISRYYIDRVYVANRGLIYPEEGLGYEETERGEGLMHFYMDILNFLSRENRRRKPTPYSEYAGDRGRIARIRSKEITTRENTSKLGKQTAQKT